MSSMREEKLYGEAYNAHERAEFAVMDAIEESLRSAPIEALACLCDPQWRWETRSSLSVWIIAIADDVLNEKLEALVAS